MKSTRPAYTLEARIETALERATRREHYAQWVGQNPRTGALVFYVKSTSGIQHGYHQYVYKSLLHGGHSYVKGLWATCECMAALNGKPCDHAAKASRAAARRIADSTRRASMHRRVDAETGEIISLAELPLICGRCGCQNDPDAQVCQVCSATPMSSFLSAMELDLEDYELAALVA